MLTEQTAPVIATWRPLEAVSGFMAGVGRSLYQTVTAVRSDRIRSKLAPRLRYDIGELDCRPPHARPLDQFQKDRQVTLEAMWLRYGA